MSGMVGISKTSTADFNQWLHAMRMVVRLPGEVPLEFRKKLWLSLADRYLHIKRIDWERESVRCLSDNWKTDDEELADQINKDVHRTGSSFCTGPSGSVNQAKLKRVLVGFARWNKEVGYCQGFNMLGALILQVVDTDEAAAIKIMIYLIEGVLPPGYFSGALTGLQADMGVFRELLSTKLPRLSKHLQKLQGLTEGLEPPLINVFTMQWFLTLFCTCLPYKCVLRIWDLILTDGGDILLRTALALWELLESRILATRTADDFYCKMGLLSGDMLNGSLIEPNELVQRVVSMGPINGLPKLRDKHLHNIAQWKDKRKLRLFYSDDDAESDDDSKVALATIWGLRLNRRASSASTSNRTVTTPSSVASTDREKIALDINLLKQQYGKLRQRQKQAQIILTAACARQSTAATTGTGALANSPASSAAHSSAITTSPAMTLNNLLLGRSALTSNKGRRGAPLGAIPPARNPTGKSKGGSTVVVKPKLPPETLHWKDTDTTKKLKRRNSLKWKDIPRVDKMGDKQVNDIECVDVQKGVDEEKLAVAVALEVPKMKNRSRSESSSYSEDSDGGNSSTSTSLCDDDAINVIRDSGSSIESSPFKKLAVEHHKKAKEEEDGEMVSHLELEEVPIGDKLIEIQNYIDSLDMGQLEKEEEEETIKSAEVVEVQTDDCSAVAGAEIVEAEIVDEDDLITSTSQLSPVADFSQYYLNVCSISPLKTPSSPFDLSEMLTTATLSPSPETHELKSMLNDVEISDDGVTNSYFERMNSLENQLSTNLELTTEEESENVSRTLEQNNSTLSIPTYEIIDTDEIEEDARLERSASLNILQPKSAAEEEVETTAATVKRSNCGTIAKDRSMKGKSSSLEETKRPVLKKSYPVSCCETVDVRRSEKALEIIQENSKILHRILKKNNKADSESVGAVTAINEEQPIIVETPPQNTVFESPPSRGDKSQPEISSRPTTRETTTSISDTLSSIEHTIKSINSLCQERESRSQRNRLMESIEEIINSGNSIKVQINTSDDINRKLNPSRSTSVSPLQHPNNSYLNGRKESRESDSKEHPPESLFIDRSPEYRSWSRASKDSAADLFPRIDKSPSSPIITRSYLESLKPTPSEHRVTKSAENSPSRSSVYRDNEFGAFSGDDSFLQTENRYKEDSSTSPERSRTRSPMSELMSPILAKERTGGSELYGFGFESR